MCMISLSLCVSRITVQQKSGWCWWGMGLYHVHNHVTSCGCGGPANHDAPSCKILWTWCIKPTSSAGTGGDGWWVMVMMRIMWHVVIMSNHHMHDFTCGNERRSGCCYYFLFSLRIFVFFWFCFHLLLWAGVGVGVVGGTAIANTRSRWQMTIAVMIHIHMHAWGFTGLLTSGTRTDASGPLGLIPDDAWKCSSGWLWSGC